MDKKYVKQTILRSINLFDLRILKDETDALYSLGMYLDYDSEEETAFRARIILDEINKGNTFTVVEKDGTRTTFRIASDADIRAAELCRKAQDELIDSTLTDEDKAYIDALEEMLMAGRLPDEFFDDEDEDEDAED